MNISIVIGILLLISSLLCLGTGIYTFRRYSLTRGRAYPPDAEANPQPAAVGTTGATPAVADAATWQPPQLDQPLPAYLRVRAPQQNQAGHISPSYQERSAIPNHQIMSKQNCWEFKKCGRQPGGVKVSEMGACLSATAKEADTANGGKNARRICWAIAGTFCKGKVQGTEAQKRVSCMSCDFYKKVKEEEGSCFQVIRKFGQRKDSPFTLH